LEVEVKNGRTMIGWKNRMKMEEEVKNDWFEKQSQKLK
jgi:hypothetical protein